jgi:hypothetical protein
MDAKEWSTMADKLAQVRLKLYKIQEDHEEYDTEVYHHVAFVRELLTICLEKVDKLANWDDKGWLR